MRPVIRFGLLTLFVIAVALVGVRPRSARAISGPLHGPPIYTAPTDTLSRAYTRSSTPPAEGVWNTDPDYLHTQKSTLFPSAPDNGTAYFMCGPNTVASLHALAGSTIPSNAAITMLSASEVNAWSIDNKFLTVVTNQGGQDAILQVNTGATPGCTGYALLNGANGVVTNGTDPTMSLTEPGVLYGNTTGVTNAYTMRWDLNANTVTTFINWATEANWGTEPVPAGPSNAIGNLADFVGYTADDMICVTNGPASAPDSYVECKWLPTGAIAWADVKHDNFGNDGHGLLFGPSPGFIPVVCSAPCSGFLASTGVHAVSPGTDGTNLYAQVECQSNEGIGPGIWKVGTTSLANATAISGGGHRSIVGSRIYSLSSGTPSTSFLLGLDLSNPTAAIPPVKAARLPCSVGTHCDDQHNSGVDCLYNVSPCWQTSGDYFANVSLPGGAPYPPGTSPPSSSFMPTAIGADEVVSLSQDGTQIYRWTHKMQNGAIDCGVDANGNCISNAAGFYNLVGGNVSPDGTLYAYSSNYNGFWGKPAANYHINYVFIMEMQAPNNSTAPQSPTGLSATVSMLIAPFKELARWVN